MQRLVIASHLLSVSIFLTLSLLELLVDQVLIMAQSEQCDEAFVDDIVAFDHGAYEVHRVVPDIVELLVFTCFTLVCRLTNYLLAILVNEGYLTRFKQTQNGSDEDPLSMYELLEVHFFVDS